MTSKMLDGINIGLKIAEDQEMKKSQQKSQTWREKNIEKQKQKQQKPEPQLPIGK